MHILGFFFTVCAVVIFCMYGAECGWLTTALVFGKLFFLLVCSLFFLVAPFLLGIGLLFLVWLALASLLGKLRTRKKARKQQLVYWP